MAYDMVNSIIDKIIAELPAYINEGFISTEDAFLETIERGPLQDDPTTRATYLCLYSDHERGFREPVNAISRTDVVTRNQMPGYEVGGSFLMVQYFWLEGWTPIQTSKDQNYYTGGILQRRIETALAKLARRGGFHGIETDDGHEKTGGLEQTFTLFNSSVVSMGGETEWYSKVVVKFQVFSRIDNSFWKA